jgi:hypothetical protein
MLTKRSSKGLESAELGLLVLDLPGFRGRGLASQRRGPRGMHNGRTQRHAVHGTPQELAEAIWPPRRHPSLPSVRRHTYNAGNPTPRPAPARTSPRNASARPTRQTLRPVPPQPGAHRLARHLIALSDLSDQNTAGDDLHDGVITLLHNAQLHEHQQMFSAAARASSHTGSYQPCCGIFTSLLHDIVIVPLRCGHRTAPWRTTSANDTLGLRADGP